MTKYQEIAQMLDANAIQNAVDAYNKGRLDERADTIEIVHRFFMEEMDKLETYLDEDDGVSKIYKDQKKAKYLLNLNKRLCTRLKEQEKG